MRHIHLALALALVFLHEVSDRHEHNDRVFALWRGSGIDAGGDVDVEGSLAGEGLMFEDVVERGFVLFRLRMSATASMSGSWAESGGRTRAFQ